MGSASPSEFLTFYRRLATSQTLRVAVTPRVLVARPFHASALRAAEHPDDKQHATRKGDSLDVQSNAVKQGTESKSTDTGGTATRQKDERDSVGKAKKDFPEAPDAAIGMQDERGGKGH